MEGNISFQISNFKFQIPRQRSGFTLIEMTVVMGMIALMVLLSATALVSVRDQYIVDSIAEEMVTHVRDAQNRAMSVSMGKKGWVAGTSSNVSLGEYYIRLYYINDNFAEGNITTYSTYTLPKGASITYASDVVGVGFVYFIPPFSEAVLGGYPCPWEISSTSAAKELSPATGCVVGTSITYSINYKNRSAKVIINEKGNAKIE